jgi:integrase
LPPRLVRRTRANKRGVVEYYFYEQQVGDRREYLPLGRDLLTAKTRWLELERKSKPEIVFADNERNIASLYARYMNWAQNMEQSGLSPRTLQDRGKYWKQLEPVFGEADADAIKPEHMMRYFDTRSAKASAKKEIKFLSVIFNWARARGFMSTSNPVSGTTRQMKLKEGRDIYVTDEMLALVYACSVPVIQDAIDLAYLTGQRPADVLNLRWDQVKDGALWIEQGKTKAKIQIDITGELAVVIDRIKARGVVGMTVLCDPKGQKLKPFGYFRSQFKLARDRAQAKAAELGIEFVRFQFKDLRAKSASDIESMASARKLLGHSTESMTTKYVRNRVGEKVSPVLISGYGKKDKP